MRERVSPTDEFERSGIEEGGLTLSLMRSYPAPNHLNEISTT